MSKLTERDRSPLASTTNKNPSFEMVGRNVSPFNEITNQRNATPNYNIRRPASQLDEEASSRRLANLLMREQGDH